MTVINVAREDLYRFWDSPIAADYLRRYTDPIIAFGEFARRVGANNALGAYLSVHGWSPQPQLCITRALERIWGSSTDPLVKEGLDICCRRVTTRSPDVIETDLQNRWDEYLSGAPSWVWDSIEEHTGSNKPCHPLKRDIDMDALGARTLLAFRWQSSPASRILGTCTWAAPNEADEARAQLSDFFANISE